MTKYVFGVMSSKYKLEANKEHVAKVCMCLFMNTSAPIAIYEPISTAIDPTKVLGDNLKTAINNKEAVKACMKTIKRVYL